LLVKNNRQQNEEREQKHDVSVRKIYPKIVTKYKYYFSRKKKNIKCDVTQNINTMTKKKKRNLVPSRCPKPRESGSSLAKR
jgi:uncharacterized protein YdaL